MTSQGPAGGTSSGLGSTAAGSQRPSENLIKMQSATGSLISTGGDQSGPKKRRNHRAGKRKKGRRQSFLPATGEDDRDDEEADRQDEVPSSAAARPPFYSLGQSGARNFSETSLASEALLDHRSHQPARPRRDSRIAPNPFARHSNHDLPGQFRNGRQNSHDGHHRRHHYNRGHESSEDESDREPGRASDRTPLLGSKHHPSDSPPRGSGYGFFGSGYPQGGRRDSRTGRKSNASSPSSRRRGLGSRQASSPGLNNLHDVNNPPSVPNSPRLGPDMGYDDVMVTNSYTARSPERNGGPKDSVIDIDGERNGRHFPQSSPPTPRAIDRRHTIAISAEEDVCFPVEGMSAIGEEEDYMHHDHESIGHQGPRRRRVRRWPDLSVLEEWNREEKEVRSEGTRTKKVSEPVLVGGRLRPQKHGWHRTEEDAPYRFTYFNEDFPSTIHSQTISELLQPGQSFQELFVPEPPEISDDDCSSDEDLPSHQGTTNDQQMSPNNQSRAGTRHSSIIGGMQYQSAEQSGDATPAQSNDPNAKERPKRYGDRPTFWLDVLSPTDTEMRVISKTFGIHPLTAEDILMQEAREKVELFPKYYFVNYRTFEQDMNSEDYLEPVNMYVVVFPEGVISFHFSMTPHPANVRRRIRQLKEYVQPSSDWISYALIDDITDVFAPLIQTVEQEVDDIDDAILGLLYDKKDENTNEKSQSTKHEEDRSEAGEDKPGGGDMLRRVGEGRKKVMLLYRLLGNKADVIKGFAKRCNEKWHIAPKSDIGLYLGDIQDHILTMTGNLNHYETLLSRAHSNFLAQMNISMNERQEQTADVLGKLTVLGTIVLPMNIITGMWGMNVLVPGQNVDNLSWFWSITGGLLVFGVSCFFIAKRVYGIV